MMDELEMPDPLAGFSLNANETVAEEIVPEPVPAIHITRGRSQREVDVAKFFIGAQIRPCIGGTCVLPRAVLPGLDSKVAFLWNNFKGPSELTGFDVVAADVAARIFYGGRISGNRRADNHHVHVDKRRECEVVRLRPITKSCL